jgi:drug/metabolite transporter (DMT)-like permease
MMLAALSSPAMSLAIMFKEVFRQLDLESLGVVALLIFFTTFVSMAVWAMIQKREQISQWSALPLTDDADPTRKEHL